MIHIDYTLVARAQFKATGDNIHVLNTTLTIYRELSDSNYTHNSESLRWLAEVEKALDKFAMSGKVEYLRSANRVRGDSP